MNENRLLIVLGMHRSGTSLLGNILSALGVNFFGPLIPGDEPNPRGYYENGTIVDLQERFLFELNFWWIGRRGTLFDGEVLKSEAAHELKENLKHALTDGFKDSTALPGFKDPRTILLLPLWNEILAEMNIEPLFVLGYRHPAEVVSSILKRDTPHVLRKEGPHALIPPGRAELIWIRHNLEAVIRTKGDIRALADYGEWFANPVSQARELIGRLNLNPGLTDEELRSLLDGCIDPGLNRHGRGRSGSDNVNWSLKVYEEFGRIRNMSSPGIPLDFSGIFALNDEYESAARLFKGLALDYENSLEEIEELKKKAPAAPETAPAEDSPAPPVMPPSGTKIDQSAIPPDIREVSPDYALAGESGKSVCLVMPCDWSDHLSKVVFHSFSNLSQALERAGYRVVCAFLREGLNENIAKLAADKGLKIRIIGNPHPETEIECSSPAMLPAYYVYEWLKQNEFNVVYYPELSGLGFYSGLGKRLGIALSGTFLVGCAFYPSLLRKDDNLEFVSDKNDLLLDYLERKSVEYADAAVIQSDVLASSLRERGWVFPQRILISCPPLPLEIVLPGTPLPSCARREITEIVYCGRLSMKGVLVFCTAIDNLRKKVPGIRFKAVFSGRTANEHDFDFKGYVRKRMESAGISWEVQDIPDGELPLDYLRGHGRLAYLPAEDISHLRLYELASAGIPFVAEKSIPGEIIGADDHGGSCTFHLNDIDRFSDLIREYLDNPEFMPRLAETAQEVNARWVEGHMEFARAQASGVVTREYSDEELPFISVCLTHYNRPQMLRQALDSLDAQTYRRFEVVLTDDGSTDENALRYLDELEEVFVPKGWRIVRQANRYLGAARNAAARNAKGEYLLFMDDDNIAKPHELKVLATAAKRTDADILNSFPDKFSSDDPPPPGFVPAKRFIAVGPAVAFGALGAVYGDANALVRRSIFEKLGGFTEDYAIGHEDWEFFARAALGGYVHYQIPEPLYWYRESQAGMIKLTNILRANLSRNIRPYIQAVSPRLRPLIRYVQGIDNLSEHLRGIVEHLRGVVEHLQHVNMKLSDELKFTLETLDKTIADLNERISEVNDLKTEIHHKNLALIERDQALNRLNAEFAHIRDMLRGIIVSLVNSNSWKLTRSVRKASGQEIDPVNPDALPDDEGAIEKMIRQIIAIYSSSSWEMTSPLRLTSKLFKG